MTVHTTAKSSLMGYKQWRAGIAPLAAGTMIEWIVGYQSYNADTSIKAGQFFKVVSLRDGIGHKSEIDADRVYKLILCNKSGRLFKKIVCWDVEGIARRIVDGEIKVW